MATATARRSVHPPAPRTPVNRERAARGQAILEQYGDLTDVLTDLAAYAAMNHMAFARLVDVAGIRVQRGHQ